MKMNLLLLVVLGLSPAYTQADTDSELNNIKKIVSIQQAQLAMLKKQKYRFTEALNKKIYVYSAPALDDSKMTKIFEHSFPESGDYLISFNILVSFGSFEPRDAPTVKITVSKNDEVLNYVVNTLSPMLNSLSGSVLVTDVKNGDIVYIKGANITNDTAIPIGHNNRTYWSAVHL